MEIDAAADLLDSLASKIESLDLTDDESKVLDTIMDRAQAFDSDEVSGFKMGDNRFPPIPAGRTVMVKSPMGLRLGNGAGVEASVLTPNEAGEV